MTYLLCRNRVSSFRRWRTVFASHASAHRAAGLVLTGFWRGGNRRNELFFLFEVRSLRKAKAFIAAPDAAQSAARSGVLDGEYHFLRRATLSGYGKRA
jgi:hypothetical protein